MPWFSYSKARTGRHFCVPFLTFAVLFLCGLPLHAAAPLRIDGLGKGDMPIDGPWQFHLGDNPAWAAPGLDDSTGRDGWEQLTADTTWGAQTHFNTSGFAWYRKRIEIGAGPGEPGQLALMIPAIDDVYEIYWNGQRVGGLGSFAPHLTIYEGQPIQIYNLGPAQSGVLAVRVFKFPFASNDDGTAGGFEAAPTIGSPEVLAYAKGNGDYTWLRGRQFYFGMVSIYTLVAFLSFLAWLRDRSRPLLLWMALYTLSPLVELFAGNRLRLLFPWEWQQAAYQTAIAGREAVQWFLLLWLLQLNDMRGLVRLVRWMAVVSFLGGLLDGICTVFYPWLLGDRGFQITDAALTVFLLLGEPIPALLGIVALLRRKRLDFTSWLVAAAAIVNALYYSLLNLLGQGMRFTHWTISNTLIDAHIDLLGNRLDVLTMLRLALFLCILYAVIRYAVQEMRLRSSLEREFQNARELQQVLVPETQPAIPGFALTSAYIPAREVGGDFYQILPRPASSNLPGSSLVVLGDVSGKGLRAAMAVSLIVGAIRTLAESTDSPAALLEGLNRQLAGHLQGGFATCIALRLDADGACTIASAGHLAPLIDGREIDLPGSLPLGITSDASYKEERIHLNAGSHLALYTDGLVEARRPTGELYGFSRMQELFREKPTASQAADAAVAFGQEDDITVLTLTRAAVPESATARTLPELSSAPA
jgi:hypothetical protein